MSEPGRARAQILGAMRRALGRGALDGAAAAAVEARLAEPPANLIPARVARDPDGLVDLFVEMARGVDATVDRVPGPADVPGAVADYLARHNLPTQLVMAPDPALDAYPWDSRPLLAIHRGRAQDDDLVSLTGAVAAVAETGTLMLASGPGHPSTLNFLPDTHVVVVRADQVVGPYEDAWARLRAGGAALPRTVNFVTGPSRTGDIEQKIQLGAHGPRRLHIVLVDG